ncbi:MAG: hypothetical protein AAB116_19190 [Candidatus Poribacteria bacterium]
MHKIKVHYAGSRGWLIFWAFIFFPVALVLLITKAEFELDTKVYITQYGGSVGWLCFWTIIMFPIALLLMALNGVSIIIKSSLPHA